jgi:hypothetical protein
VVVNLVGSFIIGLLAGLVATKQLTLSVYWREFVFVGLLGGFTTFSTFSLGTLVLARTHPIQASVNVGIQVVGSLVGAWAGYRCGLAAPDASALESASDRRLSDPRASENRPVYAASRRRTKIASSCAFG